MKLVFYLGNFFQSHPSSKQDLRTLATNTVVLKMKLQSETGDSFLELSEPTLLWQEVFLLAAEQKGKLGKKTKN